MNDDPGAPEVLPTPAPGPGDTGGRDGEPAPPPTRRTRVSSVWIGVVVAGLVLVLLLVFILQNTKSVRISFFTATGDMPLGVALLLAAVGGLLLAGVVASLRIWQLRHRVKKS